MVNKRYYRNILDWLANWEPEGHYYNNNRGYDEETGKRFGEWPKGGEIRIYRESGVDKQCVDAVLSGIYETIDDLGLMLKVNNCDTNPVISSILRSLTVHYPERRWNGETYPEHEEIYSDHPYSSKLGENLFTGIYETMRDETNGGKQHAVVVITGKALENNRRVQIDGEARFGKGYMIMSIPPIFQRNLRQIKRVSEHEMYHLLGFCEHHGDVEVEGISSPINCVTDVPIRTNKLCERDREALRCHWNVLEKEFGMKFLK